MRTKKSLILVGSIVVVGILCIFFINMAKRVKGNDISSAEAVVVVAKKYDLERSLLEYKGIDERTNSYIINLSPGSSKGAAGRTFYVDPRTNEIKE